MADASKLKKPSLKKSAATKAVTTPFKWTVEMVNDLLDILLEYNTETEYNNTDFNADKVKLYEVIRVKMAGKRLIFSAKLLRSLIIGMSVQPRDEYSSCNRKQKSVSGTRPALLIGPAFLM